MPYATLDAPASAILRAMTLRNLTTLFALSFSFCVNAQTTTHAPVHRRTAHPPTAVAKPACPDSAVTNPPGTPVVSGPVKTVYALRYVDVTIGTGEPAAPGKLYSVHYTGWLQDGTKFDSSVDRGQPIEFIQGQHRVIPGWDTAFDGMNVGGKRRLYIPYQLAYGEAGRAPIPPKAPLVFDIELVAQRDANAPAPTAAPTPNHPQK